MDGIKAIYPIARPGEDGQPMRFSTPAFEAPKYSVVCHPAQAQDGTITDWSLRQLNDANFKSRLVDVLPCGNVRELFAPTVNFMSGVMLPQESFTLRYPLNRSCSILRPGFVKGFDETLQCDGTSIGKRDGFLFSPAGCLLIVLSGKTIHRTEICLAAHAGHNSLIDMQYVLGNAKPRPKFSVVDAMVAYAEALGARPEELTLRSFFALPWQSHPHTFDDPRFGDGNQKLYEYLKSVGTFDGVFLKRYDDVSCIALSNLVLRQAQKQHVGTIEVGYCPLPEDGAFAYTRHTNPELSGLVRNLVVLVRQ